MKLRAFTLIEMIIVIVIAAILMMMVMQFGGRFVQDIKARQLREEWVSDLSMIRGRLLLSRYHDGASISGVEIDFADGAMQQLTTLIDSTITTDTYKYDGMSITGPTTPLSLAPYQLACGAQTIDADQAQSDLITLTFDRSDKTYCYAIIRPTCTIRRTPCLTD